MNVKKNNLGCLPIDSSISLDEYCTIDLSINNKSLNDFDTSLSELWENYMNSFLTENGKKVAYGGYLETRNLYDRSGYFQSETPLDKRNIHLGVDFWCSEGTKVCTVLDGTIHSVQNNTNHGDYGPTILIEHYFEDEYFYSLYGHLSLDSIENKIIGGTVKKGEVIGSLGSSEVNGDYAPHLHFQIIKDLENNVGDYPGVCSLLTLDFYKKNCPDPFLYIQ